MAKTKYKGVYLENDGDYTIRLELGRDRVTGKRLQKVTRKNYLGKKFQSAKEAFEEVTRLRREYQLNSGLSNYDMTYKDFVVKRF